MKQRSIEKFTPIHKVVGAIVEEDKSSIMYGRLNRYYKSDVLVLADYPIDEVAAIFKKSIKYKEISLVGLAPVLKEQVKAYMRNELNRLEKTYSIAFYNCIRPLVYVIPYMIDVNKKDILFYSDEELYYNYIDYFHQNYDKKESRVEFNILRRIKYFTKCLQQKQYDDIFERDIWSMDEIHLSSERLNKADTISDFEFFAIENQYNKRILKMYLKAQLCLTGKAYGTIKSEYGNLTDFILFLGDINVGNHTRNDIAAYCEHLDKKFSRIAGYNTAISTILSFFKYLYKHEELLTEFLISEADLKKRGVYNFKFTAPDDYVIEQIFDNLPKAEEIFQVMYMIQAWSGIRVSELCSLPFNCIRKDSDGCKLFIYSTKMQNNDFVIIPLALYKRIKKYQKSVLKERPDAEYLFYYGQRKDTDKPISSKTYTRHMKDYVAEWKIKNPDGTDHVYQSHSYRHKKGRDMVEAGIPLYMISQCLNHKSMNMTLVYAEARTEFRKKEFKKYISASKDVDPLKTNNTAITVEWLRDNLDKQALANGLCCLPCQVKCPHTNSCIHCNNFVTTIDYLDIHKKQLELLEGNLELYKANSYVSNIATTEKDIEKLRDIIHRLEEEQ